MQGIIWENFITGLWNISVQTVIIFCVLLLARAVFSFCRAPKKYTCFLWMILFVRLLMPVQPESPVGLWTKDNMMASFGENTRNAEGENVSGELQGVGSVNIPMESQGTKNIDMQEEQQGTGGVAISEPLQGADAASGSGRLTGGIWLILFLIWGTGCLGFLLYGGVSGLLLKKKLRCSIRREDDCYLTDGIPTAFVMGILSPKIYLPSELAGEDLTYVILHERTHIKRRDYLVKAAAYLITCIYWFHPLVWAAQVFLSKDIELSCDEAVLGELGESSRREYADTLLRLSDGKGYFAGVPLAFGEGDTENRIRHIIRYRKPAAMAVVFAVILLFGLAVILLTGRPEEEGNKNQNLVESYPEESREEGGSGTASISGNSETAEPAPSEATAVQPSAASENDKSVGENTPDSVNSRFPEPVELPSGHTVAVAGDVYQITISIDEEAYRMADLCDAVNALEEIRELGEYIVVEGHITPNNSWYGFYSTISKQWEWEYTGSLLTWDENWRGLENPRESVIYADSVGKEGVIYDWKDNMIAVFDLEEEYIYDLKREGDDITITIVSYEGESRELHFGYTDSYHTLYHW